MDLNSINQAKLQNDNNVSFKGAKSVRNSVGKEVFRVFPPESITLNEGEELGIELVHMLSTKTKVNDEFRQGLVYDSVPDTDDTELIEVDNEFKSGKKTYYDIDLRKVQFWQDPEFGYRYVVYKKGDKEKKPVRSYTDSAGSIVEAKNGTEYTIASTKMGSPRNNGPMEHIFTDSYNVLNKMAAKHAEKGKSKEQVLDGYRRNHFNRAGGSIQGIIEKIPTELDSNKLIMTTPLIGGGSVSSHMYHPANHFQISKGTGSKADFMELQKACFNSGKGYVLDGAFTSQGYEGTQFTHALHNPDSPFKYWFKFPSNEGYQLGVLPNCDTEHVGIRVVNPKNVKGYTYNPEMPTYIQFYDTRLASDKQIEDKGQLIVEYDKDVPDDPYDITMWDDGTLNNYFEVDPDSSAIKNFDHGSYEEWAKNDKAHELMNPLGTKISFVRHADAGGYAGWDGNIDLVKMNLSNHVNSDEMIEGNKQAQNYIYNVASYWTKETRNALMLDVAQNLHDKNGKSATPTKDSVNYLKDLEEKFGLTAKNGEGKTVSLRDKSLTKIYQDVLDGKAEYNSKITSSKLPTDKLIQQKILEFPLESLSFSNELLGVLSTPYITPRPTSNIYSKADDSKLKILDDASKGGVNGKLSPKMQKIYTETLPSLVKGIMADIQSPENPLVVGRGESMQVTNYGKYFLEVASGDIMQFLITESLFDNTNAFDRNGNLDYEGADARLGTKGNGKRLSIQKLGIARTTSEGEALAVVSKLQSGLSKIKENKKDELGKLKTYLKDQYLQYSPEDYKMAEAVVEQTGGGLNWRFDAAKDVGDFVEAKDKNIKSKNVWNDVISFWKPFVKNVRDVNPSSYVVAEVTSLWDFKNLDYGEYHQGDKAEGIFFQETGATTTSNYSTYFGLYPKMFGKNIEEGSIDSPGQISKFLTQTELFIHPEAKKGHVAAETLIGSHVFLDNHDKPRTAHLMAVDAGLFWSDFKKDGEINDDLVNVAKSILGRSDFNSKTMSSKAVAVAQQYNNYFTKQAKNRNMSDDQIQILNDAIRHLANGYKFKSVDDNTPNFKRAEAFGTAPFEVTIPNVIEQAKVMGLKINKKDESEIMNGVRKDMVAPYLSKMTAIYEMMSGTVGIPTLFAGAEFAQTGAEARSKNVYLGCRNLTRHDWIDENKKDDVAAFNARVKQIGALSKIPGMSAIAGGTPVVIPVNKATIAKKDELIKAMNELDFGNVSAMCKFMQDDPDLKPFFSLIYNNGNDLAKAIQSFPGDDMPAFVKPFLHNMDSLSIIRSVKSKDDINTTINALKAEFSGSTDPELAKVLNGNYSTGEELTAELQKLINKDNKAKEESAKKDPDKEFTPVYTDKIRKACSSVVDKVVSKKQLSDILKDFKNKGDVDNILKNVIIEKFNNMSDRDFDSAREKMKTSMNELTPGGLEWINSKINLSTHQTGAIYKYDDMGSGVLSIMTNAYIPDVKINNGVKGLRTKDEVGLDKLPKVSEITLTDMKGNLVVRPKTRFAKIVYDNDQQKYVEDGTYVVTSNGRLLNEKGSDDTLDSTVTFFKKINNTNNIYPPINS